MQHDQECTFQPKLISKRPESGKVKQKKQFDTGDDLLMEDDDLIV